MALVGKTANVDPGVLAFAERVGQRAGLAETKVLSGYRAGSKVLGTGHTSLHASGEAVDLGTYYGKTLTRIGRAALIEAGMPAAEASKKLTYGGGSLNGWEIIFNSWVGGNHFDHCHIGWRGGVSGADHHAPAAGGALGTAQLRQLWIAEGGNPRQANMAAEVAARESRGNPHAHRVSRIEDSRGLWQINVRAHPTWLLRDLYSPRVNAQAAIAISRNGRDWGPWSTAAAAREALASGNASVVVRRPGGEAGDAAGPVAGAVAGAAGTVWDSIAGTWKQVTGWTDALVAAVGFLTNPLNWLRALEVAIGFALLMAGLGILVLEFTKGSSGGAAGAAKTAASLTPAGRVARVAGAAGAGGST